MEWKFRVLLINAFILAQCTHALTVYNNHSWVEKQDFVTPCKQLLNAASKEVDRVMILNVFAMQDIFKKVLTRAQEVKHQSPMLQLHLEKLSNYVQQVENYKIQKVASFKGIMGAYLAIQQEKLVQSYNEDAQKFPNSFPTEVLLTIYGLRELQAVTKKNFQEICEDLDVEFGRYIRTLPREESEDRQKVLDWYEKYTNESELNARLSLIIESSDLFDKE